MEKGHHWLLAVVMGTKDEVEDIARVSLRTRHATYYLLRDIEAVKKALRTITSQTVAAAPRNIPFTSTVSEPIYL